MTVRSSPTPNVHRGERRYHVKRTQSSSWHGARSGDENYPSPYVRIKSHFNACETNTPLRCCIFSVCSRRIASESVRTSTFHSSFTSTDRYCAAARPSAFILGVECFKDPLTVSQQVSSCHLHRLLLYVLVEWSWWVKTGSCISINDYPRGISFNAFKSVTDFRGTWYQNMPLKSFVPGSDIEVLNWLNTNPFWRILSLLGNNFKICTHHCLNILRNIGIRPV